MRDSSPLALLVNDSDAPGGAHFTFHALGCIEVRRRARFSEDLRFKPRRCATRSRQAWVVGQYLQAVRCESNRLSTSQG
jgi:hypothetical protein